MHLGFLFKRLCGSLYSLLKCYGMNDAVKKLQNARNKSDKASINALDILPSLEEDINCNLDKNHNGKVEIKTTAMSTRLELYAPERKWKAADENAKRALLTFINICEERLSSNLL